MKFLFAVLVLTLSIYGLSLEQAIKKGLKYDARTKILAGNYAIAMTDISLAESNYRPTLDISGFLGREYTITPANSGKSKTYTTKNITLSGKYNLFSGYKDKFQIEEKKRAAVLAENKLKERVIELSTQISSSYIEMIKRYKIYNMYKKNINNYRRTLKKVSLKIKDGGGRDSDLFQVRSRMNYEQSNLLSAKLAYEDAKIVLAKFIGKTPSINSMKTPRVNKRYLGLKRLVRKTKKSNASITSLRIQEEITHFIMQQQQSKFYPTVDLEATKSWSKDQHGIPGVDESDRIGISVKYNLYDGGKDTLNVEKAQLQALKAGNATIDAKREIITNLKRIYSNYLLYNKRVSTINTHINNAKKTEKLYIKEEEETGERSIIDILNIQQEYNSAQIAKIDTRYTAIQLYFQLLSTTAEILDYFRIVKK